MRSKFRAGLALAITLLTGPALAQTAPFFPQHDRLSSADCPRIHVPPLSLPATKAALVSNSEIVIVALGSSSTAGWHSSDIAHSYPALLQAELSAALPQAHVAVINRGIGGQDAAEMVPRLAADALAVRPSLVIWQLGANAAMRNMDPAAFDGMLDTGISTLKSGSVDVVLMDNQRAPAVLASPERARIERALSDAAARTGVGLFSRGAMMDQWQQAGYPYGLFMSDDGIHHNDRGYRCVAKALAGAILEGLGQPTAPIRSASRR